MEKNLQVGSVRENALTVQECIEEAILKFSTEEVSLVAAGRTDSGVHAYGQVAHFDLLNKKYSAESVKKAINFYIKPHKITVLKAEEVSDEFNARFSARKRYYQYVILNRREPSVFEQDLVWQVYEKLDLEAMKQAANFLAGNHDFTSFRAAKCQGLSPIKTLDPIVIERVNDRIFFYLSAQSFLHHMVRNIVGSLKLVGNGKWPIEKVKEALEEKDRSAAGPTAPPQGLYFIKVDY